MEVMDTISRGELKHYYASSVHRFPSKSSGKTQVGGKDFDNKTQSIVDPNQQKSWVDSTERFPHSNVLYVGETGQNAEAERKIFLYKCSLLKFCNGMFGFANPNIKLIVVH
jgi:hypothetical protein